MTAQERRMDILNQLITDGFGKADNFAFQYGVSVRTIFRDVIELSLSYPVYTMTGTYGGIYIDPSYRVERKYLKHEEEDLLERLSKELKGKDLEIITGMLQQFSKKYKKGGQR